MINHYTSEVLTSLSSMKGVFIISLIETSFSGVCKSRRRLKFRLTFILFSLIMSRIVFFLIVITIINRPFPSFPGPLFQNEGRCSAFDTEMIFHSHANNTHFHKKGCTPSVILIVRVFGTRKWPIVIIIITITSIIIKINQPFSFLKIKAHIQNVSDHLDTKLELWLHSNLDSNSIFLLLKTAFHSPNHSLLKGKWT